MMSNFVVNVLSSFVSIAIIGFLVQKYFLRKKNIEVLIDSICLLLLSLKRSSLTYWTSSELTKSESEVLEATIKSGMRSISSEVDFLKVKYRIDALSMNELTDLLDLCTGGKFESRERKPDPDRLLRLENLINDIRVKFLHKKL